MALYEIATNDEIGRHLVATRDIKEGEVIIKAPALILGPRAVSFPTCLGCHKNLSSEEPFYKCSKCTWPLCSAKCESSDLHAEECKIMSKSPYRPTIENNGTQQNAYSTIAPLRALLFKKAAKDKFDVLMDMQSHLDANIYTPMYTVLKRTLVPLIRNVLKIDASETEILNICSIFDTNSFNVRDTKGLINVRGIYPTAALLTHECRHNTKHAFHGDDFQIVVTATVPIAKGEVLTTTYTQTLWGTFARVSNLKETKNFDCTCKRCSDPTELGTYVGAVYCTSCRETITDDTCPKLVSTDPTETYADWKCEKCDHEVDSEKMEWLNDALRHELRKIEKNDPNGFEEFLNKHKNKLHPRNSHVLEAKYVLTQLYGNIEGFLLSDLSDEQLQRKIDLCRELLEVADILAPGYSRFRGSLLYDLQAALVAQAKRNYKDQKIGKDAAEKLLEEAVKVLQESARILESEPDLKDLAQNQLENVLQLKSL